MFDEEGPLWLVAGQRIADDHHLIVHVPGGIRGAGDADMGRPAHEQYGVDTSAAQAQVEMGLIEGVPTVLRDVVVARSWRDLGQHSVGVSGVRRPELLRTAPWPHGLVGVGHRAVRVGTVRAVVGPCVIDRDIAHATLGNQVTHRLDGSRVLDALAIALQHVEDDQAGPSRV